MKTQLRIFTMLLVTILCLGNPNAAKAQYDFVYTQYMWNELAINPAYAGSRDALSLVGLYRNQWVGMPGSPVTTNISINAPIFNYRVGLGLNYMRDEIGITKSDYVGLSYSYRLRFSNSNLSLGLSTTLTTRKELYSQLETNGYDPILMSDSKRAYMPNASFGAYYFTDSYYFGFSIPRLVHNQISGDADFTVTNKFDVKYFHYYFTAGTIFKLNRWLKMQPSGMLMAVSGAPVKANLTGQLVFNDMFWVGAGWNSGDGVSFLATVYVVPQLRIGYAYDYTTSELADYSKGTHEISIGYDFNLGTKKIVSPRYF